MYKVLIADDEPIAADSIEYIVKKNISSIEIVGKARSGRDAIEKAYAMHPEIVLMDINMPGINGLEALRQIREENPGVRMIITTAFDYFNYALESVSLQVSEYLLKPIKEDHLVSTLNKVIAEIDARREKVRNEIEMKEKFELVGSVLEAGFIHTVCMFHTNADDLRNYCRILGFSHSDGYILTIELGEKFGGAIVNKIGEGMKSEKLYADYRNILKSICQCIVGPVMLNQIVVYVLDSLSKDRFRRRNDAMKIAQAFYSRASSIYANVSIGIGHAAEVERAFISYRESLHALRVLSQEERYSILHYDDVLEEPAEYWTDYEEQLENVLESTVSSGSFDAVVTAFSQFFLQMSNELMPDFDSVRNRAVVTIVSMGKRWGAGGRNTNAVLHKLLGVRRVSELHELCTQYLGEMALQVMSAKQKKINNVIEKANRYIEVNYDSDISLEDIAKEVNLSPFYFSHFYKEETGVSFIDSLIAYRIEKAKELLLKGNVSVKEAAKGVGYSDPNYFSKLFKKMVGITASEYKELNGEG